MLELLFAVLVLVMAPARAAPDVPPPVPSELQPWVPWILHGHPDLACPVLDGAAACIWPGMLDLAVDQAGGRFGLAVTTDRRIAVPLPGGRGAWPQAVAADRRVVAVTDAGGVPMVVLDAGEHYVTGEFRWSSLPQGIDVPAQVARVALTVAGQRIERPQVDAGGTLRLGAGATDSPRDNRLEIDVSRHIADGVPLVVTTRVDIRASGGAREIPLGAVLVPGTHPASLTADLPARFSPDGGLVVQVRPGTYRVTFEAPHEGPASSLAAPEPGGAGWPDHEFWAVDLDDRTRAVNVSGASPIDSARTTLPEEWRSLPAYLVRPGEALALEELRRGEPQPAPNRLDVRREFWLDSDGRGLTVRDLVTGTMNQGWRLDLLTPGVLGHVSDTGTDQVISAGAQGAAGVDLRTQAVSLLAESRIPERAHSLPAVGWNTDVRRLDATLHLPPGWTLLGALGVDDVPGSLVEQWSLFDLFFVLVLALATARLAGWPWGLVALVGLALSRQESDAPAWIWAALLATVALLRVARQGWPRHLLSVTRYAVVGLLLLIVVPFAIHQVERGFFPVLEDPWQDATSALPGGAGVPQVESSTGWEQNEPADLDFTDLPSAMPLSRSAAREPSAPGNRKLALAKDYLSLQQDPAAVVQTGPGVPAWTWAQQELSWSGPVTSDHTMTLLLVGPRTNLLLSLLRVALLLALALRLSGFRRPTGRGASAAAVLALAATVLAGGPAQAAPGAELLTELEQRLVAAPGCAPDCVTVADLYLEVVETAASEELVVAAEVHAGAPAAWPLPGPTSAWVPASVVLDGRPTYALARGADGLVNVRLGPGVHRVVARGPIPPTDALTLQLGELPQRAVFAGEGWTISGLHADGTTERSVQVTRVLGAAAGAEATRTSENLAPWLEVRRTLDLGIPWRVRTEVARRGPSTSPLALKVPLLPGEAVTEAGIQVADGAAVVALDRDQDTVAWLSNLDETERLVLDAPEKVPWTEVWTVSCSAAFSCAQAEGIAPLQHVQDGRWSPLWRPWPGEEVVLAVGRLGAVPGQTITIDRALLTLTPGRRQTEASLALAVRTSQGGQLDTTLPAGSRLQRVVVDGVEVPVQARGDAVPLPLRPGSQDIEVAWHLDHAHGIVDETPAVDLGAPGVNASVVVNMPDERWVLFLLGPERGPVPLFWTYVILVFVAAFLLRWYLRGAPGEEPLVPVRGWQWVLLGLGMTQVPAIAPAVVLCWFLALGWRKRRALRAWWAFDLAQLGLLGLTLAAMIALYAAIHAGLLFTPDMQIAGNGSYGEVLRWYADRVEGAMPRPVVVSLPLWTWRVAMLLWSLWLALSLVRWMPWAWHAFSDGGVLRSAPRGPAPPSASPPAPSSPEPRASADAPEFVGARVGPVDDPTEQVERLPSGDPTMPPTPRFLRGEE